MKITAFDIERFGLWSGLKVPKLSAGINVFYGANEAGKSTVLEFIRSQLYGFGDERRRFARRPTAAHVAWNSEVDHEGRSLYAVSGGMMQLECPSGNYRLRRMYLPDQPGREEQIDLRTLDGDQQGAQLLRVLVSGVDEPTFNNVFAIGLDELQRLGSLNDTEAAEMLFRLSVGMDRVSIVDAIKELTSRRNRILNNAEKENKPSLLPRLLQEREKILEEIAQSKVLLRDYVQIRNEQRDADRTVTSLEEDLARLEREKRIYEIAKQSEPIWVRRDKVRDDIDAMGTVTVVTEETVAELERCGQELERRQFAYDKLRQEYRKTQEAIQSQPVNETLWKLAPRIEVLLEEEKRIVEIDGKITELETEISTIEARVVTEEEQIKQGRRSLPIPAHLRENAQHNVQPVSPTTYVSDNGDSDGKPEHAAFASTGAVISAPSTSSTASVSSKGYRPNVDMNDILKAEALDDYRTPARAVSKAKRRLQRIKEQHGEIAGRAKSLNEKVKSELARRDDTDLAEAVEKAGETVTNLRRRQAISQRLNEMAMHHKELHRINAFLVQHQALPSWALAFIGLACTGGAIPVGFALFEAMGLYDGHISPVVTLLGLVAIVVAVAVYIISGKSNAGKLQQNQRQLAMLLSQIEHAKQEAGALDAKLQANAAASGGASIEMRYQEAQQELARLEKLVPVDAQRREANARLRQLEVRLRRGKDEYASATKRWGDWLRMAGLPGDWTPSRIRDLMNQYDVIGDLKKELDRRYELMNQRIREMRSITDRIDRMIVETGLSFEDGMSYVDILAEIRRKLELNDVALRARDKLRDGLKEFRKMRKKAVSDLRKARQAQSDLLRQYGVKRPDELVELHRRHLRHRKLLQQEQAVQRELDAAVGGFCEEKQIGELLEPRLQRKLAEQEEFEDLYEDELAELDVEPEAELQEREDLPSLDELIKKVRGRIDAASAKLHDALELRGKLGEQLKQIAEDQTTIKKQRELAILDQRIEQCQTEWRTYAASARMLDTIRVTYERERQPRTLAEASALLRRLTNGKYHRIWTPLGEETLLVDDEDGNTFDVAWLSRGTREQLFIALRLALASAFAQHGSILPIILDDVLVNFDSKRAFAAARVFLEFAKSGRQIFLFTCHEHICRMFQKLDVPVRILPPVDEPGRPTRVLLPRSILQRREAARKREAERLAREEARRQIDREIADREEAIRREVLRKADVQRLILQMQQIATAEKAVEAGREGLQLPPSPPPEPVEEPVENAEAEEEWWEDEEEPE